MLVAFAILSEFSDGWDEAPSRWAEQHASDMCFLGDPADAREDELTSGDDSLEGVKTSPPEGLVEPG